MNKLIIPLIITAICALTAKPVEPASTYTVDVQDFNELTVKGGLNVVYRCSPDSSGMAIVTSSPQFTQYLRFNNDGIKLKIELSDDMADTLRGLPTVTVYSSLLTKAEYTGDSLLIIHNPHEDLSLKLKLSGDGRIIARNVRVRTLEASVKNGSGEIMVYGKCGIARLNHSVSSKGKIDAQRLVSTNVKCSIFGKGEISCNVNKGDLTLQGISGSTVYYRGKPANIKNRATNIKLINLDEADAAKPQNYPLDSDNDPE